MCVTQLKRQLRIDCVWKILLENGGFEQCLIKWHSITYKGNLHVKYYTYLIGLLAVIVFSLGQTV